MKTFHFGAIIALFLLFFSTGMLAQTAKTKLNQVELMKLQIGTWKVQESKK